VPRPREHLPWRAANAWWYFFNCLGVQTHGFDAASFFAVAARPGDVAAAEPEPQTLALALRATMVVR